MANQELNKLLTQQAEIASKIEELKNKEREPILADIKSKIAYYGFSAKEVGFTGKATKTGVVKSVEPLYINEEGKTWSGRGKPPLWIAGPDGKASEKLKKKFTINK
ncbi:H-NS histone family protein [Herbaspirillum sp. RTI4]|uniref:H-NS histone family protein n=1 Tax=Herbaspirillum sp. RTI4 TaxID=3048640 RepID=UPI002AB4DE23|nr:H-NS histone family protein [Herbaspirillum sp. RTI4]MDY7579235.1 H-NS histone family protein [Herbaspirillum sp. RTI4]MEA9982632.1 H-NS histone family protein [Herbaspirillum sp. RTI4]